MSDDASLLVSLATLIASVLAALGTLLNWWHERSKRNEVIDATIEWVLGYSAYDGPDYYPTLIVHNRSLDAIAISDVSLSWGWFIRKRVPYTALDYEDPEDLNFPYVVAPGEFWKKRVSNSNFLESLVKAKFAWLAWQIGRSSIWIRIETMRGTVRNVSAMRMIAMHQVPDWLKD